MGYRKGKKGGAWIARFFLGDGKYQEKKIGTADDVQDADGVSILSFGQAQELARVWFSEQGKRRAGLDVGVAQQGYTVKQALDDYLAWFTVHRRGLQPLQYAINAHILPELGRHEVEKLSHAHMWTFHENLASQAKRKRTRPGEDQKFFDAPSSPEEKRQRKVTANRILNVLKAALNKAYLEGRVFSDEAWRRVKPFRGVNAAKVQYLTEEQCRQLVEACEESFRPLVQAAILTGCRYSEISRLTFNDFNQDSGTLFIQMSKNGKPRNVVLTEEGISFFADFKASNSPNDLIFIRPDGTPWGKSHQARPLKAACDAAKINPPASFHILRHTHASHLAMQGAPLAVIAAQLGHSDTRMAENHYAHLAPNYIAETIRNGFPKMGIGRRR